MYVSSALTGRNGLCVLLENVDSSGNKKYGLIDTGNPNTAAAKVFLNKHGVKSLDFLILTHLHTDHADGTVRLMEMVPVNTLPQPAHLKVPVTPDFPSLPLRISCSVMSSHSGHSA
jgi:glyoxylase-like metal-dependent hydrolase (beta-lactamase superfamily II)